MLYTGVLYLLQSLQKLIGSVWILISGIGVKGVWMQMYATTFDVLNFSKMFKNYVPFSFTLTRTCWIVLMIKSFKKINPMRFLSQIIWNVKKFMKYEPLYEPCNNFTWYPSPHSPASILILLLFLLCVTLWFHPIHRQCSCGETIRVERVLVPPAACTAASLSGQGLNTHCWCW